MSMSVIFTTYSANVFYFHDEVAALTLKGTYKQNPIVKSEIYYVCLKLVTSIHWFLLNILPFI